MFFLEIKSKYSSDIVEPLRYFASQVISLQIDQCLSSDVLKKINIVDYSHLRMHTKTLSTKCNSTRRHSST